MQCSPVEWYARDCTEVAQVLVLIAQCTAVHHVTSRLGMQSRVVSSDIQHTRILPILQSRDGFQRAIRNGNAESTVALSHSLRPALHGATCNGTDNGASGNTRLVNTQ